MRDSLLLALAGTAVRRLLSVWITDVVALAPSRLPRLEETSRDAEVFLAAVAVYALTTVLFWDIARVARFSGRSTGITNASGHGNTETRRGRRYRAALVSAEVSLGTLLAIASGLLLLSLRHVMNAPKGFTEDSALIADFTLLLK